jgi:hypothetical protein
MRRRQFGDVRPIIHADFKDHKFVVVGSRLYYNKQWKTFTDFLLAYIRDALGIEWGQKQLTKPLAERHTIMKWYDHLCRRQQGLQRDENGFYSMEADGITSAFVHLAYDLYVLGDHGKLQEQVKGRLLRNDHFFGARYELFVAATCIRAGFSIEYENESDQTRKHPEFIATHKATGFVMAVEAKARHRSELANEDHHKKAGVRRLLASAAKKRPGKPYAVFVEVNLPPHAGTSPPSWISEARATVTRILRKSQRPEPLFDLVLFTNIPHHYGAPGEPDPAQHFWGWKPLPPMASRVPEEIQAAIMQAMVQYGNIPKDFPEP